MIIPGEYALAALFVEVVPPKARQPKDDSLYAVVWNSWQARLSAKERRGSLRAYTQGMQDRWAGNSVHFLGENPFHCEAGDGLLIDLKRSGSFLGKGQPQRDNHVLQAVVGDDELMLVVEIVFPDERCEELRKVMVAALATLQWDRQGVLVPTPQDTMGLPVPEGLRWMGDSAVFSQSGKPDDHCPYGGAVWFTAWRSSEFSVPLAQEHVRRQWEGSHCEDVVLDPVSDFKVRDRKSFELVSRGTCKLKPYRCYTAVINDPKKVRSLYCIGMMPEADAETWLPRLRAAVRAWQPPPDASWHDPFCQ